MITQAKSGAEQDQAQLDDIVLSIGLIPDGTVLRMRLATDDRLVNIRPPFTYPPTEDSDVCRWQEVRRKDG